MIEFHSKLDDDSTLATIRIQKPKPSFHRRYTSKKKHIAKDRRPYEGVGGALPRPASFFLTRLLTRSWRESFGGSQSPCNWTRVSLRTKRREEERTLLMIRTFMRLWYSRFGRSLGVMRKYLQESGVSG